jgi:indole-3-glycerol phosphate synthase
MIPAGIPVVAESGIKTAEDVAKLAKANFNAVLVGETLMRAADRPELIREFKEA